MRSIIRKFDREFSPLYYPKRDDNKLDVCPVDAFAGQTFNVSVFGHIRSDVSVLMECQSQSEKDLIAQRLVAAQGEEPDNSGLTDSDLFKFGMSRYYQTPAEVAQFSESLTKAQMARSEKLAKEAKLKADRDAFIAKQKEIEANLQKAREAGQIDANGNVVIPKE